MLICNINLTINFIYFQISLIQLDSGNAREEPRTELRKYCELHQLDFWSCVNRTLEGE